MARALPSCARDGADRRGYGACRRRLISARGVKARLVRFLCGFQARFGEGDRPRFSCRIRDEARRPGPGWSPGDFDPLVSTASTQVLAPAVAPQAASASWT